MEFYHHTLESYIGFISESLQLHKSVVILPLNTPDWQSLSIRKQLTKRSPIWCLIQDSYFLITNLNYFNGFLHIEPDFSTLHQTASYFPLKRTGHSCQSDEREVQMASFILFPENIPMISFLP